MATDKNEFFQVADLIDQDLTAALLALPIARFLVLQVSRRHDMAEIGVVVAQKPPTGRTLAAGTIRFRRLAQEPRRCRQGEAPLAGSFRSGQQQGMR